MMMFSDVMRKCTVCCVLRRRHHGIRAVRSPRQVRVHGLDQELGRELWVDLAILRRAALLRGDIPDRDGDGRRVIRVIAGIAKTLLGENQRRWHRKLDMAGGDKFNGGRVERCDENGRVSELCPWTSQAGSRAAVPGGGKGRRRARHQGRRRSITERKYEGSETRHSSRQSAV